MTADRPTWAVVIPAYNAAGRIGDALRSLHEQTERPDEIVVCDDGSEDDLTSAVAPYRDVTVVRQENRGPSSARNTGAAHVRTSEWILFLDSDDWIDPDTLAGLRDRAIADPDTDLLVTDAIGVDGTDGRELYRYYERTAFPYADQRRAIVQENFLLTGVSVRRSRFDEVGGFDESVDRCEDYDLWMRLILSGSRVGLVTGPVLHRRHHGENLSSQRRTMLGWRVEVLRRGLARDDLTTAERAAARASLRRNERLLRRYEAGALIDEWADDRTTSPERRGGRRAAARLLCRSGPRLRQRTVLTAGLLAPRTAGRLVSRLRSHP